MNLLFISSVEIMVILLIVVMLFGAKKIPEIAHGLGKGMRQIKDATNSIKKEIQDSVDGHELGKTLKDISKDINKVKEDISDVTSPIKRKDLL